MNRKGIRKEIYNWVADKMFMEATNTEDKTDRELELYTQEQQKLAIEMRRRAAKIKTD